MGSEQCCDTTEQSGTFHFQRSWDISIQVLCTDQSQGSGIFSSSAGEAATKLWRRQHTQVRWMILLDKWIGGWVNVSTRWQRCFLFPDHVSSHNYIWTRWHYMQKKPQPTNWSSLYIRLILNWHHSRACHFNCTAHDWCVWSIIIWSFNTAEPYTHACMWPQSYIPSCHDFFFQKAHRLYGYFLLP